MRPKIIGCIHLPPLPGSPFYKSKSVASFLEIVSKEAEIYKRHGLDGVIVENMHDVPYVNDIGPQVTSFMTIACQAVRSIVGPSFMCGTQVLSSANFSALAIAKAASFDFIRVENFVFSHIGDEGFVDSCAGPLLRYRRSIDAENVKIFCDVKKKHSSHTITNDLSLGDITEAVHFFRGDAVIITGKSTGKEPSIEDVKSAKSSSDLPVFIGSGVKANNVHNYLNVSGLIIGSEFKENHYWKNPLSEKNIVNFMERLNKNLQ